MKFFKIDKNKGLFTRKKFLVLGLFLIFVFTLAVPMTVKAVPTEETTSIPGTLKFVWEKIKEEAKALKKKGGSMVLNRIITKTLNRLAYDAANQLTTGAEGQKPQYITKGWGEYFADIGDAAAGDFLDQLNTWGGMNLCEPDLGVKLSIGFGLSDSVRPVEPKCKATSMVSAWDDEFTKWKDMTDNDFGEKFFSIFQPTQNELSVTLGLFEGMQHEKNIKYDEAKAEAVSKQGYTEKETVGGTKTDAPGTAKADVDQAKAAQKAKIGTFTGDALTDASNVFLEQLALNFFQNALRAMTQAAAGDVNENTAVDFTAPDMDPTSYYGSAQSDAELRKILIPRFDSRGDYDILAELATCPQSSPAPTNCVIDDDFRQAISEQKTVGKALKEGFLHKDWRLTGLNQKTQYNEAYTYRSLLILRKYRIIPLGWEEALYRTQQQGPATFMDLVSCFDVNDDYYEFSQDFIPNQEWCRGLIDPNWVLKAPLNYCKKQGPSYVVTTEVADAVEMDDEDDNIDSQIFVTRNDEYCADEQSCIKEKSDGSCEAYGYCTEEKRTWNFYQDSCDPVYNTCQTFRRQDSGQSVSFLKNTLEYDNCTIDSVGCKGYSLNGPYDSYDNVVAWNNYDQLFLNKNAIQCDSEDEGCDRLIRVKDSYGHNFILNGDFQENLDHWPTCETPPCLTEGYQSSAGLELSGVYSLAFNPLTVDVGPQTYNISGKAFTFSFYAKDCDVDDTFGFVAQGEYDSLTDSSDWRYYRTTHVYPSGQYLGNQVDVEIDSLDCKIDKVKLELGDTGTYYSDYGANNIVNQKMIPEYLWEDCYNNPFSGNLDFTLKEDAPAVCSNEFTRLCNANEADCQLFSDFDSSSDQVAAKVSAQDYCPSDCNNYDIYIQKESYFTSTQGQAFIPETADTCSAAVVGCSEFTNLDALEQGGESQEYYSYLRQCIKPNDNQCGSFYIWQGSDQGGYQLKSYNLKTDVSGGPAVTEDDSLSCDADIYSLSPDHPDYNPDCYEFYNVDGEISYHLYTRTITCSSDCHPYRMTERNIEPTATTSIECNQLGAAATEWDSDLNACYYCKNGGAWSDSHNACLYQAIPGEGITCDSNENSCQEYNGNSGNNIKIVDTYDFELNTSGWTGMCGDGVTWSSEALNNGEHSLFYDEDGTVQNCNTQTGWLNRVINGAFADNNNGRIQVEVGGLVNTGSAYTLKFLAKANVDVDLQIYFQNSFDEMAIFNIFDDQNSQALIIDGDNDWNVYQVSLDNLDHAVDAGEVLIIESDEDFYLDDIVLTEVVDRYYLIKNSWQTPDVCYYDTLDNYQGADYNLGCNLYTDRDNQAHYLRQFSQLCQDSAVGCQLMVDTKNTKDYDDVIFNDNDSSGACEASEEDCVDIEEDELIFAVYDQEKICSSEDKGCQRFGQPVSYGQSQAYSDIYLENDPDKYSSILCSADTANCKSWVTPEGDITFFKDPGNKVCAWRQGGPSNDWAWYKNATKKCDNNNDGQVGEFDSICSVDTDCIITELVGDTCSDDDGCRLNICEDEDNNGSYFCSLTLNSCGFNSDCPNNNVCSSSQCFYSCEDDSNDYPCPVDTLKTIGYGGLGRQVKQPDGWAGLCEAQASTCTEFIDPLSQFVINLLVNPTFEDVNLDDIVGDYWDDADTTDTYQNVSLIPNRLYILGVENLGVALPPNEPSIWCDQNTLYELSEDNNFLLPDNRVELLIPNNNGPEAIYTLFMSSNPVNCQVRRGTQVFDEDNRLEVILKEAIIDYQTAKGLDRASCNGKTELEGGCVLFNERNQNNSDGLSSLIWNAYDSYVSSSNSPQSVSGYNNANSLIKVQPNRICGQWLACQTKIINNEGDILCYDVADCDVLDKDGECANFLETPETIHNFIEANDKNASGYSLLNQYHISNMREIGANIPEAHFDFEFENDVQDWGGGANIYVINEPNPLATEEKFNVSYPAQGIGFMKISANTRATTSQKIPIHRDQNYYINYLINASKLTAGKEAKVNIYEVDLNDATNLIASFANQTSDWERKIYKFTPSNADHVVIEVTSDDEVGSNSVYIDDINIEPALKVNEIGDDNKKYLSRDCRLYPKQDSLSCQSTSQSVISNGWQGYCLQKDPYYPDICLMWYPVDVISAQDNSTKDSGYQGKTPLYYCTEADANFEIVESRRGDDSMTYSNWSKTGCFEGPDKAALYCSDDGVCHFYGNYEACSNMGPDYNRTYCATQDVCDALDNGQYPDKKVSLAAVQSNCGNSNYIYRIRSVKECVGTKHQEVNSICVPVNDGRLWDLPDYISLCTVGGKEVNLNVDWPGWYEYDGDWVLNEGTSDPNDPDQLLKVYDFTTSSLEKFREFLIRCNSFDQVVKDDGTNKAWAVRSTMTTATNTPSFFSPPGFIPEYNGILEGYGYGKVDPPFGSAILDNSVFNSGNQVYFKTDYLDKEMPKNSYAGMPYGCTDADSGTGSCFNTIGICDQSPGLFCLYAPGSAEAWAREKQCHGDPCQPLNLTDDAGGNMESDDVLKTFFLKAFTSPEWDGSNWLPLQPSYNFSWDAGETDAIPVCSGGERGVDEFCKINPEIINIQLKKGDTIISFNATTETYLLPEAGVYDLYFNSIIDAEQLPLAEITIGWEGQGGETQLISNQDYHPDPSKPHIISHNYSNITPFGQEKTILIMIKDNWGFNKCCASDGFCGYQPQGGCGLYCPSCD